MHLLLRATTAACALLLAQAHSNLAAAEQSRPREPDPASLYQQPTLDGLSMAFAYDHMDGITPDFRSYAERSTAYTSASAFDRDAVLAREVARLQQQFRSFDPTRVYDLRLRTELRQYETARGGYALALGEDSFIPIRDPATFKNYGLQFRNTGDVNFIGMGDAAAARTFTERNRLNTQSPLAGIVLLEMAFRLVEAPPAVDQGGPLLVRADILAARVLNETTGAVIHDFGLTQSARSLAGPSAGNAAGEQAVLKAADVQGLRLGMSQAEAEAIASRGWTTKRGSQQDGQVLWFNALQARQGDWAVCGSITNSFPPPMDLMVGASPPSYRDCVGYGFARMGASNGPYGDRVGQVAAQQFLAGGDAGTLRKSLEEKYGRPTYVRGGGSDLVWVGRDPAKPDGDSVKVEALLGTESGGSRVVLQVSLMPYVDPQRPKPVAAQPAVSGSPRL